MAVSDAVKIERERTKQKLLDILDHTLSNPFISSMIVFIIVEYLKRGANVTTWDGKKEPWMGGTNGDLLEGAVLSADVMKAMSQAGVLDKLEKGLASGGKSLAAALPAILAAAG